MRHGSLFSGIGGFELAAEWAGWTNSFHCEWNEFGKQVLQYYWPESESFHDIKQSDFKKYEGRIDIITGGFPCQPFSAAGKRKGADDDRYLWPEMLRVIDEVKPRWVVGENVAGLISMVQPGDEVTVESGRTLFDEDYTETVLRNEYVIETVCKDLERIGYTVQPVVIPACAAGAPHRRDRIWFIAHTNTPGLTHRGEQHRGKSTQIREGEHSIGGYSVGTTTDTIGIGCGRSAKDTGYNTPWGYRHMVQNSGWNGDEVRGETERCGEVIENTVRNGRLQRELGEKRTEIRELRDIGTGSSVGVHISKRVTPDTISNGCEDRYTQGGGAFSGGEERGMFKPSGGGSNIATYTEHDGLLATEKRGDEPQSPIKTRKNKVRESEGANSLRPGVTTNSESNGDRGRLQRVETENDQLRESEKCRENNLQFGNNGKILDASNTRCIERQNWLHGKKPGREATEFGDSYTKFGAWTKFPTVEPTICRRNDGVSSRLVGITVSKHRIESIKAYGNAIVPQVAYQIFKAINEYEQIKK